MKYEQQIDRFLFGQMSSEEESSFIQECKTNKELKDEAVMMALLVKTIKQYEVSNLKSRNQKTFSDEHSMKENGECKVKVRHVMDICAFISEKNKKSWGKIHIFLCGFENYS